MHPVEHLFLESGHWTKPTAATWVRVELQAGTAGGASDGSPGQPGEHFEKVVPASDLPDRVAVEVGAGGRPRGDVSGGGWCRVTTYFGPDRPATTHATKETTP